MHRNKRMMVIALVFLLNAVLGAACWAPPCQPQATTAPVLHVADGEPVPTPTPGTNGAGGGGHYGG